LAVSPDNIVSSAPFSTAKNSSVTSALFGRMQRSKESRICVATIQGLPNL